MFVKIPTACAHIIRVDVKNDNETFTATSPDLNIFVTGSSLGAGFSEAIERAIVENFSAMGQEPPMSVIRANWPTQGIGYWYFVAIPANLIEALAEGRSNG